MGTVEVLLVLFIWLSPIGLVTSALVGSWWDTKRDASFLHLFDIIMLIEDGIESSSTRFVWRMSSLLKFWQVDLELRNGLVH